MWPSSCRSAASSGCQAHDVLQAQPVEGVQRKTSKLQMDMKAFEASVMEYSQNIRRLSEEVHSRVSRHDSLLDEVKAILGEVLPYFGPTPYPAPSLLTHTQACASRRAAGGAPPPLKRNLLVVSCGSEHHSALVWQEQLRQDSAMMSGLSVTHPSDAIHTQHLQGPPTHHSLRRHQALSPHAAAVASTYVRG